MVDEIIPGEGAVMNCSANLPFGNSFEARDLVLDRLHVEIFQFALAFRRVLLLSDMGETPHQARDQLGKFLEFAPAPAFRYAGKSAHALRHVSLKADPRCSPSLPISMPAASCLSTTWRTALSISAAISLASNVLARFLTEQQIGQFFIARQAADMGGQDAIPAEDHRKTPVRGARPKRAMHHNRKIRPVQQSSRSQAP